MPLECVEPRVASVKNCICNSKPDEYKTFSEFLDRGGLESRTFKTRNLAEVFRIHILTRILFIRSSVIFNSNSVYQPPMPV